MDRDRSAKPFVAILMDGKSESFRVDLEHQQGGNLRQVSMGFQSATCMPVVSRSQGNDSASAGRAVTTPYNPMMSRQPHRCVFPAMECRRS